jgi:hypothetical protein
MKLLSTYYSNDEKKKAEVFFVSEYNYRVVVRDGSGSYFSTTFANEESAENYAESWVL